MSASQRNSRALMLSCFAIALVLSAKVKASDLFYAETFAGAGDNGATVRVSSGDDLQAALDGANPGDTLLLEAGATFTGNFVLSGKGNNSKDWITIRSAAPEAELPPAGARIHPGFSRQMPKLVSPNSEAALKAENGAHHLRLLGIELTIAPDVRLNYGIVKLGEGNETDLGALPHDIILERCYIHGQPLADVSRGVALNSASSAILDSYIGECHAVGFDTQAICGWNGPGPFKIINNYLEGAGENVLFGGADPKIANLVPSDIEFRQNHLAKPLVWREGILTRPANLSVMAISSGNGALTQGQTYYYRIATRARAGQSLTATSAASDEVAVTLQMGENQIAVTWDAVDPATASRVYRTTDAPTAAQRNWLSWDIAAGFALPVAPHTFLDNGLVDFLADAPPPARGTRWSVKNLFELKNARNVVVEGNLFENNWVDAQSGVAILFTVRNQEGTAPWSVVEGVTFTNNVVRHSAGAINLLGRDNNHPSQPVKGIRIINNLFVDIDHKSWGGNGAFLTITEAENLVLLHNTVLQSGNIISAYGNPTRGFKFMNNILMHNEYGIIGDGTPPGNATLESFFPDKKFKRNAFIGGRQELYPAANFFFPAIAEIGFSDYLTGAFDLLPISPLKALGSDGKDIGCDMNQLREALGSQATAVFR